MTEKPNPLTDRRLYLRMLLNSTNGGSTKALELAIISLPRAMGSEYQFEIAGESGARQSRLTRDGDPQPRRMTI